ncbi:MAG TPA: hypothetical protein DCW74_08445, partial [Alteromonas australica]|nr:hypothetical protein [Alteromonas australica]
EIQISLSQFPEQTPDDVVKLVSKNRNRVSSLDFISAINAGHSLGWNEKLEPSASGLRAFIKHYILSEEPWWTKVIPHGRSKLMRIVSGDIAQCFREAALLDAVPSDSALEWWDEISAMARAETDIERMKNARLAERLSLEHETSRLRDLGVIEKPEWMSIQDNSLGYDILSYDVQQDSLIRKMIEVKSTTTGYIHLSRNEWRNAQSSQGRTFFHIWKVPEWQLEEIETAAIAESIPQDRGNGHWQEVIIKV